MLNLHMGVLPDGKESNLMFMGNPDSVCRLNLEIEKYNEEK